MNSRYLSPANSRNHAFPIRQPPFTGRRPAEYFTAKPAEYYGLTVKVLLLAALRPAPGA